MPVSAVPFLWALEGRLHGAFEFEGCNLLVDATAKSREAAIGSDDAVAGDDHTVDIATDGSSDSTR